MHDHLGDRNLTQLLQERVDAHGERTFLVFEDRDGVVSELTYAEFAELVGRCARGLADLGLGPGDFAVVHLANSPEFMIAWFALARLGAVLIPSNVANTAAELEHILSLTEGSLVITEPRYLATAQAGIAAGGTDTMLVVARGREPGHVAFADLLQAMGEPPSPAVASTDLAELIFTSGTTRKPRGVMLTHANCIRAGLHAVHCLWLDEGERCLTALPLFHVNAQAMSALAALTVAGTLVLLEEFRASKFWNQVRAHEATQTCLVAMQLRTMLAQPPSPQDDDHSVRRLFYAINVTTEEKEAFEARFGVSLINGYGCSEAMTLLTCAPVVGPRRWPSVGLAATGRRLLLLDERGHEVAPGDVGEVVAEGIPGRDFMLGYYRDEAATDAAIRDGRLHTGDNLYADDEGFLFFFDRKKDMIKRAGENVSALEVETVLAEHPMIAEVSVFGIADAVRDEAVAAVIVAVEPGALIAEEVIAFCRARLSAFKVPTLISFASALPKTSIGKVRKDVLRQQFAAPQPRAGLSRSRP
jgi:crotonobetaine/carnitine-CoA ligase